jgi:hypothetical protein
MDGWLALNSASSMSSAVSPVCTTASTASNRYSAQSPAAKRSVRPSPPPLRRRCNHLNPAETRFDPAGGALVVRVFPISGFQGLMRVQDALARVSTIRAATVETYAQGEARLRLQLGASIVSSELAAGVQARLGQQAIVRAASIADRSVLIVLE